mmetsp:Transcript_113203/g.320410  ORF Transcript_113203/g.320410 Transcript_113203/m.320410 type:complete len:334 (-) Transcript_113203:115-1116(-)
MAGPRPANVGGSEGPSVHGAARSGAGLHRRTRVPRGRGVIRAAAAAVATAAVATFGGLAPLNWLTLRGPIGSEVRGVHPTSMSTWRERGVSIARRVSGADAMSDEPENVFDMDLQDLALDVRELLITDGNLFFIGPDTDSYRSLVDEVAGLLNYTSTDFDWLNFKEASIDMGILERTYTVPPLVSVQRWPWAFMMHGLIIWLDPDGYSKPNVFQRDRIRKLKVPKKKKAFGPEKPHRDIKNWREPEPPGDPIDMWMEADVHVDVRREGKVDIRKLVLGSIINTILENPPKWRTWTRQAKQRGSLDPDFKNPLQIRRDFHSYGMSPRLNRLLNA